MDLSKLSDDDLRALAAGDMTKVSDAGLRMLAGKAAPPQPRAKLAPEDTPSFGQTMLISAGRTFDRIGKGMQQLYYGATNNDAAAAQLKAQADSDDAAYAPLKEARPWATGIGEAVPSLVLPGGSAATLLGNAGRMALAGGLPAALEYGSAEERLKRGGMGAAAGAAVPLGGAVVKSGWSFGEPLFNKGREAIAGRVLNRVASEGNDAAAQLRSRTDVVNRLKGATEMVPGSAPTAAQVAESGGIAALERQAAAANPADYTRRAMEQSSARMNALRSIAGDDAAMASALAARDAAKSALYAQADVGIAPVDGFFKSLLTRPQFAKAVNDAQELAKNSGLPDIFFRNSKGEPVALIGQGAHYVKKALDEMGEFGSASYTGKTAAGNANKTNELFQNWLKQHIPEYDAGRQAFAAGSKPINQMEIGRALLDKAQPALADFGALGRETGATYATALRNADALAAKATGFPGARMSNVLDPQQMALVEGVAKDLARKANAQDLGRGVGSDTFQKLSMQNIAQQSGMPRAVGGLLELPGVSRATAWAYRDTDQKMQALLADALLDPKKAAELMERADKKWLQNNPTVRRLLEQATGRLGLLALPATEALAQ